MNKQIARTLNSISQRLPTLIRDLEKIYGAQATLTIEKIDRPLLLTRGEIQNISDAFNSNPQGLRKELYISSYLALYDDKLVAIPSSETHDFTRHWKRGIDIIDFLIYRGEIEKLKAIIHVDLFQTYDYDPLELKLHWFKIQVAIPKDNKTPQKLIQDEIDRGETLDEIRRLRART